MADRMNTDKVSRRQYFAELRASKVVVSPFGFGEITLKDFEVFLTGGLLLKPDMSHMRTWPDVFRAGETVAAYAWDLSDFEDTVARIVERYDEFRLLAEAGQQTYLSHLRGPEAQAKFVCQLQALTQ